MIDFFADNFSNCVVLAVLLLACLPMLESKVAIPFALSTVLWGQNTLSPTVAFFVACAGSMIPAIFVILLARFLKRKTSGFVHDKFLIKAESKYKGKLSKLGLENSTFRKCMQIATFVAVPLPMTGVYTGSLIAGLTNLKVWQSFVSVLVGELISCAVVLLMCLVLENSVFYVVLMSLALVVLFVILNLIMLVFKKIKMRRKNREIEIQCL